MTMRESKCGPECSGGACTRIVRQDLRLSRIAWFARAQSVRRGHRARGAWQTATRPLRCKRISATPSPSDAILPVIRSWPRLIPWCTSCICPSPWRQRTHPIDRCMGITPARGSGAVRGPIHNRGIIAGRSSFGPCQRRTACTRLRPPSRMNRLQHKRHRSEDALRSQTRTRGAGGSARRQQKCHLYPPV